MPTKTNAVKIVFAMAAFLISSFACIGQDTLDINTKLFERYWTKPRLIPKVGLGVQETAFVELGIQLHKIYIHPLSLASAGPYFSVDGLVKDDEFIIGPKAGYEITAGLIGVAADVTYYSDFDNDTWVFTPRAGLSIMGFVNLFYGRNLFLSDYQFESIDKNRFSLVFNLNKYYFNLRNAPKKREKRN